MTKEESSKLSIPTIPDEYFVAALRLIGMASLNGAYHASEFKKVGEVYDLLSSLLEVYADSSKADASSLVSESDVDDKNEPPLLTIEHLFTIEVAVSFALKRDKLDEQKELAEAVYSGFKEHNDALRESGIISENPNR
ncbi:MAG: hypothetical protein HOM84_07770 [Thiotrichales bacterium]|nr:hypothetical protein [Thiotrichales bacterium]MBT4972424.1 hypothetical protein [Thiotrichales bacterium]MBT6173836.1 hypothetical protein [Thiotrichales bacterium]MBT6617155.1 hypothetical protein [Thiotrichales bacterium]MBT6810171.1 hypothetical protein [Thiotrichales bacterium]